MFLGISPDPAVHAHRVQIVTANSHISYLRMLHYDQWCLFTTYLWTFTLLILIFPTHLCYIMTYRHLHWGTWHIQDQCKIYKNSVNKMFVITQMNHEICHKIINLKLWPPKKLILQTGWGAGVCPLKINDLELNRTLIFITRIVDGLGNWQEVFAYWE